MPLINTGLTYECFIYTFVIAFFRCIFNSHFPAPVFIIVTSKKFSFFHWSSLSIAYFIALFVYLKYSENYETDVLYRIVRGCQQRIFYALIRLSLMPEFLALLYLTNAVEKRLISQPLILNQSDLIFPKYACDYQK